MKRIRYAVAMSLDGYIAGPSGEADWIIMDPDIDFGELFKSFDTILMGRRTYEATKAYGGGGGSWPGMKTFVVSRSMKPAEHPDVTVLCDNLAESVQQLRLQPGKDIWLFGGGELFRTLLDLRLVDTVELGVIPVLLGGGIPLLPAPANRAKLKLNKHRVYSSGTVGLEYTVEYPAD